MNYEQKYKEALERARVYHTGGSTIDAHITEVIFPELKESDDEKIRKDLIQWIDDFPDSIWRGHYKKDILSWLEKQGEQPTDKIEPKFKVGDWVVSGKSIAQISDIQGQYYIGIDIYGNDLTLRSDKIRLWTLQDAKEGDVLAFDDNTIVIFKDLYNATTFHSYCHIEDGLFGVSEDGVPDWWEGKGFYPATKEQRDLLFQKMKEAGYEWDADKEELKKFESKTLDADKVIKWIDEHVPTKFEDMENYVKDFKQDFGLC